jgi:hypothetical protein
VSLSSRQEPLTETERKYLSGTGPVVQVAVPIDVAGAPDAAIVDFSQLALEIGDSAGERYQTDLGSRFDPYRKISLGGSLQPWNATPRLQVLTLSRALYGRIGNSTVTLRGKLFAEFHRRGTPIRTAMGPRFAIPGVVTCSTIQSEMQFGMETLKVDCESPTAIPSPMLVTLLDPKTGRVWNHGVGPFSSSINSPRIAWLSPLNRRDTIFQLGEEYQSRGSQWVVPREALATAQVEVVPEPVTGYAIVEYELSGIVLSKYVVPPAAGR